MRAEPAEAAQDSQGRQIADCVAAGHQVQRGVEVAADEPADLDLVEPGEPAPQPHVAECLLGPGHCPDLRLHGLGVGMHVDHRPVREAGPVGRMQGHQVQPRRE